MLKKIEAEKERLYEEGEIRKPKNLPTVKDDEFYFDAPSNWKWTRLGEIGDWGAGATPTRSNSEYYGGDIPWLKTGELNDSYIKEAEEFITEKGFDNSSVRLCKPGDVLIAMYGATIGKLGILEFEATTNQACCACTTFEGFYNIYLYYYLLSMRENFRNQGAGGAQPNISKTKIENTVLPLPPLAEQNRIVQKIDSLFAEVDELEEKLNRQTKLDEKLQLAVNAEVQKAPDAEASKSAWNFITSNFNTLYNTPEAIDNLKKNILNEAVRGRLVPQNPNDEPATELLKKIEAEKERLYEEGEIRKPKKLPPVKEDDIPFEIPESWEWCRLGDCSFNLDAKRVPLSRADRENKQGEYPYYGASGIIDHIDDYIFEDDLLLIGEDGANLINRSTPIAFIATGKYWVNNHAHVLDAIDFKLLKWLEAYVNSINLEPYVTGTAQPKLNQTRLNKILVALPPLEEQHRIVRRIEELFAICDRFKAQLEQRRNVNERLVKGLVGEVLEGS
ncbi:MAG: restriction endonuclease subunit S [Balneolaceae bacterium]|nr:restriction endonuclease subunit S [Balneolaceae bacterium]